MAVRLARHRGIRHNIAAQALGLLPPRQVSEALWVDLESDSAREGVDNTAPCSARGCGAVLAWVVARDRRLDYSWVSGDTGERPACHCQPQGDATS